MSTPPRMKDLMAFDAVPDGSWLENPKSVRNVLKFLVSKLSPSDLEELDKTLTGESEAMASDARLGNVPGLQYKFLEYGPRERKALREAISNLPRSDGRAPMTMDEIRRADPDAGKSVEERFPGITRLRGY